MKRSTISVTLLNLCDHHHSFVSSNRDDFLFVEKFSHVISKWSSTFFYLFISYLNSEDVSPSPSSSFYSVSTTEPLP